MSQIVNRKDLDFLLYEVIGLEALLGHEKFSAYDQNTVTAAFDTAQKIAEELYYPCAAEIDAQEPQFEAGRALTHPAIKPALAAFADAGFFAAGFDEELGGLQTPSTVQTAINGMFLSANLSIHNYASLTIAAANLINTFGSNSQKDMFLPPMLEGRWFGTMCLSETQAGSSLSDITTKATPTDKGYYTITGSKMWISGGEQDISENIIHMVLAKIPGGPPGVKGISLFIVPKHRVDADGAIGEKNNITLAGLNHKMGNRGTTNTLLNFGEHGECQGWLVGEAHQGLRYMFHMMNEARIFVGHGACMLGLAGYLHSLDYAQERPQGRLLGNKDPVSPQVAIINHADVKRLLLTQKAYVEGGLALVLYCASIVDQVATAQDENKRDELRLLLDLLTPIAKSWPSEFCLEANKHAIQILGGYGYTKDYPVERFYRDNRLNPIHEGAHAIHGLDILGRKVRIKGGAALAALKKRITQTVTAAATIETLSIEADGLNDCLSQLLQTTDKIISHGDPDTELANATLYLDAFGHIVVAWLWLKQGVAICNRTDKPQDDAFERGKLNAMRFFYRYELPKTRLQLSICADMDDTCLSAKAEEFIG